MKRTDEIHRALRRDIIYGKLMQGERITEAELTRKFECSRGPVREALVHLSKEGFILLSENKGAIVRKLSAQEVRDYYALLEVLEGKAVQWATTQITSRDLDRLVILNNSLRELHPEDENYLEEWCLRNSAFHEIFRSKCGNHQISWITSEVRQRIFRYLYSSLLTSLNKEYIDDHDAILEAVRRRDSEEAKRVMEKHISRAKDCLLRFLNQTPGM